jgi:hypothetical protein
MGFHLSPELEAKCLAMAGKRPVTVPEPAPKFDDETAFQAAVVKRLKEAGWLVYHTYDSRKSEPGFPDLICLRDGHQLVAELKIDKSKKPTAAQQKWLKAFQRIPGAKVFIWSPEDWDVILREIA